MSDGSVAASPQRTPALARQLNDRAALDLLALRGPLSRTELREQLGISQPTVVELVKRLESAGHVQAVGEERQSRLGPKATLYGLVRGVNFVVGANVRDNRVCAVVGDLMGGPALQLVDRPCDGTPLPEQVAEVVFSVLSQAGVPARSVQRTVLGVPGVVTAATGDLGFSWDLPHLQGRFLAPLQELLSAPVQLFNGVQLAAFAESASPGRHVPATFALLWMGTGVGACLMVDGKPLKGASGAAGQIGYTPVPGSPVPSVRPQPGGFEGDLQASIGEQGLRALAQDMGLAGHSPSSLLELAAQASGAAEQQYADEVARRIAVACASIASVVDPGLFILQGPTALGGGDDLAARVGRAFATMSPFDATVVAGQAHELIELEGALELGRSLAREDLWGGAVAEPNLPRRP
ncbi:ROK family protein [Specibacter sp. NPDC057265]|uniref:ROK family transcriptional regulator n=1 Tax=Specibacter sp. NPDC057265 TaxID=3346075 RepID=UPI00364357EB